MWLAFIIIIIHIVADFIFQDKRWVITKHENIKNLFAHSVEYSIIWIAFSILIFIYLTPEHTDMWYIGRALMFGIITFILHTPIDYFITKIATKKIMNNQYATSIPNFGGLTVIAIGQLLFYGQLFLTFQILSK